MGLLGERVASWMTYEPVIGLLMIVATIVLFYVTYRKNPASPEASFWNWARRVVEAAVLAVLFLGLLWGFRAILNDNYKSFTQSHGRISQVNYNSVKKIWGSPHVQRELQITHFVERSYQEEIPRADPAKPPLYKTVKRTETVEQNSILSSSGQVHLSLSKRKKGSAYYSGFTADFAMNYKVINDSNETTDSRFYFPLESGQLIFNPFEVTRNGKSISRELRFSSSGVRWSQPMAPGETLDLRISYKTRGLEYFYYQLPKPREIRDFTFKVIVDGLAVSDVNYPEGCLPPEKDHIQATPDGKGTVLSWKFNNTLTTAGMGIALPSPSQPGEKVASVLRNSPYALMMLIVAISLTFLIQGKGINFLEIALLSAVYSLLFITLSAISDYIAGFWGALMLGAVLTMGMTYLLFQKHTAANRVITLAWVGFYSLIYPLFSLFPEYQQSFDSLVVMSLIVYLFFLSWYCVNKQPVDITNL